MKKLLKEEQGSLLLMVLFSILILCTALMVVNSYLEYRCMRVVRVHQEFAALNLAESGVAFLRREMDQGRVMPGAPAVSLELGGGTIKALLLAEGGGIAIRCTATYKSASRTVQVSGRMEGGRFRPTEWK